jgi:hypothetical protein
MTDFDPQVSALADPKIWHKAFLGNWSLSNVPKGDSSGKELKVQIGIFPETAGRVETHVTQPVQGRSSGGAQEPPTLDELIAQWC